MLRVLRLVLASVGIAALAFGIYKISPLSRPRAPLTEAERQAELYKRDRENLASETARDADVYGALVRLGQKQDSLGRQEALKRVKGANRLIREAAANALGFFDDAESLGVLRELLSDKDVSVVVQAIHGLGNRAGVEREKILKAVLAKHGIPEEERVAALSSLLKISGSQDAKLEAVGDLVKLGRDKDLNRATHAAMNVVSLAPRDPRVLEMLREILTTGSNAAVEPTAIRHLSAVQDTWLRSHLGKFLESPAMQTRLAVVQSLHMACPEERWTLLEKVITNERDRIILNAALLEPQYMPGPEAKALMERMMKVARLEGNEVYTAKNTVEKLKNPGVDPCLVLRGKVPTAPPVKRAGG